jgi:hypothetical protein
MKISYLEKGRHPGYSMPGWQLFLDHLKYIVVPDFSTIEGKADEGRAASLAS